MLHYFMINLNKRILGNLQKNIRQYYRMKYIEIVKDNFTKIYDKDLWLICSHLIESITKDHYNYITKWRSYPLFKLIEQKTAQIMK